MAGGPRLEVLRAWSAPGMTISYGQAPTDSSLQDLIGGHWRPLGPDGGRPAMASRTDWNSGKSLRESRSPEMKSVEAARASESCRRGPSLTFLVPT